eukprot:12546496-Alexandrium_andersonii.AAC.1
MSLAEKVSYKLETKAVEVRSIIDSAMAITFGARKDLVASELKAVFAKQLEAATKTRNDSKEWDSNPAKTA